MNNINVTVTAPIEADAVPAPVKIKKYVVASVVFLLFAIGGGISLGLGVWQYQLRLAGAASHLQYIETFACGVRHD